MFTVPQTQTNFQDYLDNNHFLYKPKELYEPLNYMLSVGGKRLRPVLLLMACNLFKESIEDALPAAYGIELFHNYSLIHDDIMDEADTRRGMPTIHTKYNTNIAILAGDVMLSQAYHYISLVSSENLPAVLNAFVRISIDVCEGQQFDMNFESTFDVSIEEYVRMIGLKTASLLSNCMRIGAIIGGAQKSDIQNIAEFGRNIGIAFQIQDDILDTFGDPEKFGKKIGGDIIQNKKTYLVIKALEVGDAKTRKELINLMSTIPEDEQSKIASVKEVFQRLDVPSIAEKHKEVHLKEAYRYLDLISVKEERKQPLRALAAKLMNRQV